MRAFHLPSPPDKFELIGHILFDGWIVKHRYRIDYCNKSKPMVKFVNYLFKKLYKKAGKIYFREKDKVWCLELTSKKILLDLLQYLPEYSISLLRKLPKIFFQNKEIIRRFLRAFWDDEGTINSKYEIFATIKNRELAKQLARMHTLLGIKDRTDKNNVIKFAREMGFVYSIISRGKQKGRFKKELLYKYIQWAGRGGR